MDSRKKKMKKKKDKQTAGGWNKTRITFSCVIMYSASSETRNTFLLQVLRAKDYPAQFLS